MTTRQKIGKLLDQLSEDEIAAEYQRLRQAVDGRMRGWQSPGGVLCRMTEDEEKVDLSWEEFRPQRHH